MAIGGVRIVIYPGIAEAEARTGLGAALLQIATEIAAQAAQSVPVESGEWQSGIHATGGAGAKAYVMSDDEESIYKEYGTSHSPAHGTLTNAARAYGKYTGMEPR